MMKKSSSIIKVLTIISLLYGANVASTVDEELEVILQFFEFELEDNCKLKSEAQWDFLSGKIPDLQQLLRLELREAELYKNETRALQEFFGKTFSNKRLQRLLDLFFYPGAPLLGLAELKEYKEHSTKLLEITKKMTIGCPRKDTTANSTEKKETEKDNKEECIPKNVREVNKILAQEKDEKKLKELWSQWFEELEEQNRKTRFDFMQQLSILDMEAEQNEEDDLSDYWLKQTDTTELDYHKISLLWKELIPLYQKLRKYMASIIEQNYGNVFIDKKLFPLHLLGSLRPESWVTAAEKLGAFDDAKSYELLKSELAEKTMEALYRIADNFTSELKIGDLPPEFYEHSNFNVTSPFCEDKTFDYCTSGNKLRAIACGDEKVTITRFIKIHEDVAKLKHLLIAGKEMLEEENGFLFREGPRDSVIYEAVASLSSLIATRPTNLRKQHLLPEIPLPNEDTLTLLMSALNIIPSLPYYLAADLWRINALKEMDAAEGETTYEPTSTPFYSSTLARFPDDESSHEIERRDASEETDSSEENEEKVDYSKVEGQNMTEREEETESTQKITNYSQTTPMPNAYTVQSIGASPKVYDFENLTADWWKYREQLQGVGNSDRKRYPDFLLDEKIIWNKPYASKFLGKILQFQLLEYFKSENITTNTLKIQSLLHKGKSKPYQEILAELFNITEISTKPLLEYFKPLEVFLDAGGKFQNKTSESDSGDFNLFSDSYAMKSPGDNAEKVQKSSNTVVFALVVLGVLGIVIVTVFVALRRYRRKQKAKERRKRLNELVLID